jgi:predicted transcriptional regulator
MVLVKGKNGSEKDLGSGDKLLQFDIPKPHYLIQEGIIDFRAMIKEMQQKIEEEYFIRRSLECKVDELETKIKTLTIGVRIIGDDMAEEEIKARLIELKRNGINKISLVDLVDTLRLPVEQIESIMDKLKNKGVKELD